MYGKSIKFDLYFEFDAWPNNENKALYHTIDKILLLKIYFKIKIVFYITRFFLIIWKWLHLRYMK